MGTVGNLGNYQRLIQLAKAANGPVALGIYVVAGSFLLGAAAGPVIKKSAGRAYSAIKQKVTTSTRATISTYVVASEADAGMGLALRIGDEFRVLECDGDMVLIEVLGNEANPYAVSASLLEEISDYVLDGD